MNVIKRSGEEVVFDSIKIENAIKKVLADGLRTGDIFEAGCQLVNTKGMGDAVVAAL